MMDALNALAGLLVGLIVGLTGVGGGSLMSPLLILMFGVAPATAIGTDLWFAAVTKTVGGYAHHRHASVDFGVVRLLAIGSIPAALLTGLWLWHLGIERIGPGLLSHGLGAVLVATAVATLFRGRLVRAAAHVTLGAGSAFRTLRAAATVGAGAILGLLVTLTSVGAGALGATMLLMLYPRRLSLRKLVGTDIVHAVPIALVGGLVHLLIGTVDFRLLGLLLLGSIPGIVIGARLSALVPEKVIQPALAAVLAFAGYKLLA
ncbi:sulfite exporter TauE/SafE family protein [Sphingomonas canadensis]|uniref:Probable membrane transporter protein n=1 Tax=Sphingomonas canadensis TaxID=1219257 RepID=A0ABW3H982_9SPHN|nr:sulfite exporter TauE/SafE family protein [Sphingomonas canadensis]MCW3835679.1 sulfite exporter TauE/SafE family protein [Sphingomonas canadensis]